jgi:hypothetical protein
MSMQAMTLPVDPYSSDPVGDAVKALNQVAPGSPISWTYSYDPQLATLGQGTGRWKFRGVVTVVYAGSVDPVQYIAGAAGCEASSVGGAIPAPCPMAAITGLGMTQVHGGFSTIMTPNGGARNASVGPIVLNMSPTNAANFHTDLTTCANNCLTSSWSVIYYNDPQTAKNMGTGIWRIQGTVWFAGGAAYCMIQSGGCALSVTGGMPGVPPPASLAGYTQTHSLFSFL